MTLHFMSCAFGSTVGSDVTILCAAHCVVALTDKCLVRVNHSLYETIVK